MRQDLYILCFQFSYESLDAPLFTWPVGPLLFQKSSEIFSDWLLLVSRIHAAAPHR